MNGNGVVDRFEHSLAEDEVKIETMRVVDGSICCVISAKDRIVNGVKNYIRFYRFSLDDNYRDLDNHIVVSTHKVLRVNNSCGIVAAVSGKRFCIIILFF